MPVIQKVKQKAENVSTGNWRIVVSALITGAMLLFGWSLYETYAIGTNAITKQEFHAHETENREDFKETQEIIRTNQARINDKLDKIKEIIIDKIGD